MLYLGNSKAVYRMCCRGAGRRGGRRDCDGPFLRLLLHRCPWCDSFVWELSSSEMCL